MIASYEPPKTTLTPIFINTGNPVSNTRVACAVGVNYRLSRFGVDYTVNDGLSSTFAAAGGELPFKYLADSIATVKPVGEVVDDTYVKLYGTDLEAEYASIPDDDGDPVKVLSLASSNVLKLATSVFSGTGTLHTLFRGREAAVGDTVVVTSGAVVRKRKVVGFRGIDIAASYGTNDDVDDETPAGADTNPLTTVASYTTDSVPPGCDTGAVTVTNHASFQGSILGAYRNGSFQEVFTLTVTTAGSVGGTAPEFRIESASGLFGGTVTATESAGTFIVADADPTVLGGITVTIDPATWVPTPDALSEGDTIVVTVTGSYTRLTVGNTLSSSAVRLGATSAYTGTRDTQFIIEVVTGTWHNTTPTATGGVVRVTDTAGLYGTNTYTLTEATEFPLGASGLRLIFDLPAAGSIPQKGLRKGDRYTVSAKAASESTVSFDKLVLDGPAVDTALWTDFNDPVEASFRVQYSGLIARTDNSTGDAWAVDSEAVAVEPGLAKFDDSRDNGYKWLPYVDGVGKLSVHWRSIVAPSSTESILEVTSDAEIEEQLGKISQDNDVAFAAHMILQGGAGLAYALRVAGADSESFAAALAKIARRNVEYIAVVSDDADVRTAARSHVVAANSPTRQMFREAFLGMASPGEVAVYDDFEGDPLLCTVTNYGGSNVLVTLTQNGATIAPYDFNEDDVVVIDGERYAFDTAVSDTEFLIKSGPNAPITPAATLVIKRADTAANNTVALAAAASALSSEYVRLVWTEGALSAANEVIEPKFVAAYIAGLRSATHTHVGLTNTTMAILASAIPTFTRYTDTQLNTMAANGVMIVSQEAEGSPVIIRHALTTRTDNGALSYEEMVVTNVVRICRNLKTATDPFRGRTNVNEYTAIDIADAWTSVLSNESKPVISNRVDIGPAIIGFDPVTVSSHGTVRDRFVVSTRLIHQLPANQIDGTVYVDQSDEFTVIGATTETVV